LTSIDVIEWILFFSSPSHYSRKEKYDCIYIHALMHTYLIVVFFSKDNITFIDTFKS